MHRPMRASDQSGRHCWYYCIPRFRPGRSRSPVEVPLFELRPFAKPIPAWTLLLDRSRPSGTLVPAPALSWKTLCAEMRRKDRRGAGAA